MATKPFYRLYYHVTWATLDLHKLITPEIQEQLYRQVIQICDEADYATFAVNGMEDHIHLVMSLRPEQCLATVVENLKKRSADFCNQELDLEYPFRWHEHLGALTFAKKDLSRIIDYVFHQKLRHQHGQLNPIMEKYWQDSE